MKVLLLTALLLLNFAAGATDSRIFASLYTWAQIRDDLALEGLHYQALQQRFDNNDFDEILFGDARSRSPRLALNAHHGMFLATQSFLNKNAHIDPDVYLKQRPSFAPFAIKYANGQARAEIIKPGRANFGAMLDSIPDSEGDPKAWGPLYRAGKSDEILKTAAQFLVGYWRKQNHITQALRDLPALEQIYLRATFQREVDRYIKEFQMPGKLANNIFRYLNFDVGQEPTFPRDGLVAVPMSRWEALFKGIGPGECIRASCNRFFDALYPDALAFALRQDGKEIGYVGIYRVWEKDGNRPFWYIDTLQTPGLVSPQSGSHVILDALLLQLAQYAASEGAKLAVADANWNSINFKENVTVLQTRGVREVVAVAYEASPILADIYEFVAKPAQRAHQKMMDLADYIWETKQMYDSLRLNDFKVRVLETPVELLNTTPQSIPDELRAIARENGPGIERRKFELFRRGQILFRNQTEARELALQLLFPLLYSHNPQFNFNFPENWRTLDLSQQLIGMPDMRDTEQRLNWMSELLMLPAADSAKVDVVKTFGRINLPFAQWFVHFAIPVLRAQGFSQWPELYEAALKFGGGDPFVVMSFAYEINAQIGNADQFASFAHLSRDQEARYLMTGDKGAMERLISTRALNFLREYSDFPQLLVYAAKVIPVLNGKTDVAIRAQLFEQARDLSEVRAVADISIPPPKDQWPKFFADIARAVKRVGMQKATDFTHFETLLGRMPRKQQPTLVLEVILPGLRAYKNIDWLNFYAKTLPHMMSQEDDVRLADGILKDNAQIDLAAFVKLSYSRFKGVHLATDILRGEIFARALKERLEKANPGEQSQLTRTIFPGVKDFNFDLATFLTSLGDYAELVPSEVLIARYGRARDAERTTLLAFIEQRDPATLKSLRQQAPKRFANAVTMLTGGLRKDPVTRGFLKLEGNCAIDLESED